MKSLVVWILLKKLVIYVLENGNHIFHPQINYINFINTLCLLPIRIVSRTYSLDNFWFSTNFSISFRIVIRLAFTHTIPLSPSLSLSLPLSVSLSPLNRNSNLNSSKYLKYLVSLQSFLLLLWLSTSRASSF